MSGLQQALLRSYAPASPSGVKLLMHFDGTSGSQTFIDSAGGLAFTADDSNPTIQPSVAAFGSSGLSLPVANSGISATWPSYLSLAGELTIELIWMTGATPNSSNPTFVSSNHVPNTSGDRLLILFVSGGVFQMYGGIYGFTDTRLSFPDFTFAANTTYRLAVTRDSSNVVRGFCNGVVSANTYGSNNDWTHVGFPLQIGAGQNTPSTNPVNGIDELRITQACLYTANYTVATAAFPNP